MVKVELEWEDINGREHYDTKAFPTQAEAMKYVGKMGLRPDVVITIWMEDD